MNSTLKVQIYNPKIWRLKYLNTIYFKSNLYVVDFKHPFEN